ncbi:MAG: hypothetical protein WCJ71_02815 [Candidatus Omnitrophota bacterium]
MYSLIIAFGFLLAMRGARHAPLQRPMEGLKRLGFEAVDLFLTVSLILALWALAITFERIQPIVRDYGIFGSGLAAYLLSRYQKKTDVFFLSVVASVFMIHAEQCGPLQGILLAGVVSAGIALFQICFLGLRYKLLFSNTPPSMKGWPSLCLLAGFIALVLWCFGSLVF